MQTKVIAGPFALAGLDCNTVPANDSNRVASITLGNTLTSGSVVDVVSSTHTASNAGIHSTSTVQAVSLLGGAITAKGVHAVATSTANSHNASSNADGSSFVGLVVLGVPVHVTPPPNTMVRLPGIGYVVLNEQITPNSDPSKTSITVNMVHVHVTMHNSLGLRVGTEIIVGHAETRLEVLAATVTVQADSFGLFAKGFNGNLKATSGPWAPADIGCGPGSARDQILSVSSPVGTIGHMVDVAMGDISASGSKAKGQSDIAKANVVSGLLTADAVETIASVQLSGAGGQRAGSTVLLNAKIAGTPISAHPAPNTRINIANLGYVIVNEQFGAANGSSASETVNGMHLFVTMANSFNLPIGATIVIAHAHAATTTF
jgi:hypothetical protein